LIAQLGAYQYRWLADQAIPVGSIVVTLIFSASYSTIQHKRSDSLTMFSLQVRSVNNQFWQPQAAMSNDFFEKPVSGRAPA
jgi:hypothetical protein